MADLLPDQLESATDIDAVFCVHCGQPDVPTLHDPKRCGAMGGETDDVPVSYALEIFDKSCEQYPDLDDTARALHCAIVATREARP